ncbi:MAG TPA: hypothetical protein PKC80_10945 [Burkholderiaceae bacterium]|nr:hypothetical protein [Burkholderiaceae bacterium]
MTIKVHHTLLMTGAAGGLGKAMHALPPFFGAMLLVLLLVTYVPALSLWLPGLVLK